MATVTDTLETILRLVQLNTFLRGFQLIAGAISEAEDAFVEFDTSLLRSQFMLEHWGASMPIEELSNFTRQLSLSSGQTQQDIAATMAYLARFRGSAADTEHAVEVLSNVSLITGRSMERLGRGVEAMRLGRGGMFWRDLGIQVKGVEGQVYSLNQAVALLEEHFGGFADQFGETLPGSLRKTQAAFQDMLIQLGLLLSPAILATAKALQVIFEAIAEAAKSTAAALGIVLPDLSGAGGAAGTASRGINRTEEYLRQITHNTGPQGPLGRALLGGGSFAQPGGGIHIRDFNSMFRQGQGTR